MKREPKIKKLWIEDMSDGSYELYMDWDNGQRHTVRFDFLTPDYVREVFFKAAAFIAKEQSSKKL